MKRTYHVDGSLPGALEIFVYGSNLQGLHHSGAAKYAREKCGAQFGKGVGIMQNGETGQYCYALPTKATLAVSLRLHDILGFIVDLNTMIKKTPGRQYFITRVGCGLAGFKDYQIAPMFVDFPDNCSFAEAWKPWLEPT
jgi:hypothetical protein